MTELSVLLICHDPVHARELATKLKPHGIAVSNVSTNLMDAYSAAEETSPEFVLVEDRFVQLPEFEMVLALFKAMDIRWLAVGHFEGTGCPNTVVSATKSGLFPVSPDGDARLVAQRIKEITRAPQKASEITSGSSIVRSQYSNTVVLIGSSTGGVDALSNVLRTYPSDCPPTVIVQHTGKSFGAGLIRLLDRLCPAEVTGVEDGILLAQGRVCVAAGIDRHVQLSTKGNEHRLQLYKQGPVSGHLPSIDVLYGSVTDPKSSVGVLLTGMGRDGAEGLLKLRQGGAQTIGQDEASSVVYGMPRVAAEIGAVQQQLPLDQITAGILKCCSAVQPRQAGVTA